LQELDYQQDRILRTDDLQTFRKLFFPKNKKTKKNEEILFSEAAFFCHNRSCQSNLSPPYKKGKFRKLRRVCEI